MHEFSTMQNILNTILDEAYKYKAKKINKIVIEIGELTFLAEEQLKFAFEILKEGTIFENAELIIKKLDAKIRCKCGYEGKVKYAIKEDFHLYFPILKCPICGGEVEIIKGRECLVKKVEMEIENVQR